MLLTAKSKLLHGTIPRNELSAIMLRTEVAFLAKKAIGERVKEVIYVTDSTKALSWCHNKNKKLRFYVRNQVETILCMCEWNLDSEEIPLFHIDGNLNILDLLTKHHKIGRNSVDIGSPWQNGVPWMKLETEEMSLLKYTDISVSKSAESAIREKCFEELFMGNIQEIENQTITPESHAVGESIGRDKINLIVDPIQLGWQKSKRMLGYVFTFMENIKHKGLHKEPKSDCEIC